MTDRFVVLGVAGARAEWFASVGQWAHAGYVPVDFVKCVSGEQAQVRLRSGRLHSAALFDGNLPTVDRDLIAATHEAGAAVVVVDNEDRHPHWIALGADATLGIRFGPDNLIEVLRAHAAMVPEVSLNAKNHQNGTAPDHSAAGDLVVFCGPGGTGASTLAMGFAQQWRGGAVLADLCRNGEQGVLHDAGDVGPGIQEIVDQCRTTVPDNDQVRGYTYAVTERGYALLLGLRRPASWPTLRPRAVATAVEAMQATFAIVVCDCDSDFEGQADGGSLDVEERNAMARTAIARADRIFAVGHDGIKGIYSLSRVIGDLVAGGLSPSRVVPVFNRTNRSAKGRSRVTAALAALLPDAFRDQIASPIFIVDRERDVERALLDRTRLPAALGDPLVTAYRAVRARTIDDQPAAEPDVQQIRPGALAAWHEEVTTS